VKVSDLSGYKLDYWAGIADGVDVVISDEYPNGSRSAIVFYSRDEETNRLDGRSYCPSKHAGDAIDFVEKDWIGCERPSRGQTPPIWRAITDYKGPREQHRAYGPVSQYGETYLIAVTRCKVASHFGAEVPDEIPEYTGDGE
jgi:hypothetical protein